MVTIRLSRQGKRNDPFYRVVVVDSTKKVQGQSLAILGYWHPRNNITKVDKKAIDSWVTKGAIVSPAVTKLIQK